MDLTLLHATWTPVFVLLFIWLARPRGNPLVDLVTATRRGILTKGGRLTLFVFLGTLGVNFIECVFDPAISASLPYEMTSWVRSIEGDLVERVQTTLPEWSIAPSGLIYLSGYIAMIIAPLVTWTIAKRPGPLAGFTAGFLFNYLLALPFYFLFPVDEVGWSALSDALPLLDTPWPGLSAELRSGSALDNCFPSLHVSVTTTVAWFAMRHGPTSLRILAVAMAVVTAYLVMALGVHWGLDVVVGVPFGILCALLGQRAEAPARRRFGT